MCLAHIKPFSLFTRCRLTCRQNVAVQAVQAWAVGNKSMVSKNIDRGEEKKLNILTDSKIFDNM